MTKSVVIDIRCGRGRTAPGHRPQLEIGRDQHFHHHHLQHHHHQQLQRPHQQQEHTGTRNKRRMPVAFLAPAKNVTVKKGQKELVSYGENVSGGPDLLGWGVDQSRVYAGSPDSPTTVLPEVHTFPGLLDDQQPDDDHADFNSIPIAPLSSEPTHSSPIPSARSLTDPQSLGVQTSSSRAGLENQPGFLRGINRTYVVGSHSGDLQNQITQASNHEQSTSEMIVKEETMSPIDIATPGPSPSSSGYHSLPCPSHVAITSPSPVAPLIPLTALELLSKDSSDSTSEDEVFVGPPAGPSTTGKKSRSKIPNIADGSGKSTSRSSTSRITAQRKSDVSSPPSDNDSSEDIDDQDISQEDSSRLERRRHSNRVAAQKCRQRQRHHYRGLTKEIQEWECKNTSANYEVRQLQKELKKLMDIMENHESACGKGIPPLTETDKAEYAKLLAPPTANTKKSTKSLK